MESSDKAVAIVISAMCLMGAIGVIAVSFKEVMVASELAKSGLQQCVVEVNNSVQVLWKKECDK